MKRFVLDPSFLELFPKSRIGVLVCKGIDNHVKEEERYAPWLRECEKLSSVYTGNPEFTENETIRNWRDAFYRFKTKKGARCSIEALLKRVSKGGEDIGKFEGELGGSVEKFIVDKANPQIEIG